MSLKVSSKGKVHRLVGDVKTTMNSSSMIELHIGRPVHLTTGYIVGVDYLFQIVDLFSSNNLGSLEADRRMLLSRRNGFSGNGILGPAAEQGICSLMVGTLPCSYDLTHEPCALLEFYFPIDDTFNMGAAFSDAHSLHFSGRNRRQPGCHEFVLVSPGNRPALFDGGDQVSAGDIHHEFLFRLEKGVCVSAVGHGNADSQGRECEMLDLTYGYDVSPGGNQHDREGG